MARIRTFIALEIAAGVRDQLIALQRQLAQHAPDARWETPANMHVTLLFLGEVNKLDVVPICRVVQKRARKHQPFTMEVAGLGAFPNTRRPKTLWAGIVDGVEELRALHDDLEEGILELGNYRREDRGYTPHLTLGRLKSDDDSEEWSRIIGEQAQWIGGASPVDEVVVMQSDLRGDGPRYTTLGRAKLG